jgi:hypothetical protein
MERRGGVCLCVARRQAGNDSAIPNGLNRKEAKTMSKKKASPGARSQKKAEVSLVRSSAAEYLTFVAAHGQGGVEAVYADENVWLSQEMMGLLYDVETHTVNYHLKKVIVDNELQEDSVIRNFRITAADGKTYDTQHYNIAANLPEFPES